MNGYCGGGGRGDKNINILDIYPWFQEVLVGFKIVVFLIDS